MQEITELSLDELGMVTGGVLKTVNTGTSDKAAIRSAPGSGDVIASLANDTIVDTIGSPVYDSASGRHWIQVKFKNKKGRTKQGWIAASILGMKR